MGLRLNHRSHLEAIKSVRIRYMYLFCRYSFCRYSFAPHTQKFGTLSLTLLKGCAYKQQLRRARFFNLKRRELFFATLLHLYIDQNHFHPFPSNTARGRSFACVGRSVGKRKLTSHLISLTSPQIMMELFRPLVGWPEFYSFFLSLRGFLFKQSGRKRKKRKTIRERKTI